MQRKLIQSVYLGCKLYVYVCGIESALILLCSLVLWLQMQLMKILRGVTNEKPGRHPGFIGYIQVTCVTAVLKEHYMKKHANNNSTLKKIDQISWKTVCNCIISFTCHLLFHIPSQNALLPAGFRQKDQTTKPATGPFDRERLLSYLEKQALEHKDREDFVPFTGEKKGTATFHVGVES